MSRTNKLHFIEAMLNWFASPSMGRELDVKFLSDTYDEITAPAWVSVEYELPPHRNQTNHKFENDFSVNCFVSDGKDVDTGYYDYRLRKWNCEFLTDVVYWYCPQPPRKEERNESD